MWGPPDALSPSLPSPHTHSRSQDLAELLALREGDSDRDIGARLMRSVSVLLGSATAVGAGAASDSGADSDSDGGGGGGR